LKQLAASGQLAAGDLVWKEDMDEWKPASKVKGLFPKSELTSPDSLQSVPAAAPPALPQKPESAVENWHYSIGGNQNGPVSFEELKRLAAADQLGPSDLVWREGDNDWQPAGSVTDLLSAGTPQSQDRPQPPPVPSQTQKQSPQATPKRNGKRSRTPPPIPSRRRPPSFPNATTLRKDQTKIDPTARKRKWYYAEGTQQRGPVSFQQLGQLVAERKLGPSDWVWNSSLDEWNPACKIEDLSTTLDSARTATATKPLPTPKSPARLPTKAALATATSETLDAETATVSEMAKGQIVTPKRLAISGIAVVAIIGVWGISSFFDGGNTAGRASALQDEKESLQDAKASLLDGPSFATLPASVEKRHSWERLCEIGCKYPSCVAFSADSKILAVGADRGLKLYDTADGSQLKEFESVDFQVSSAVFSPNGNQLAYSGGYHPKIHVRDTIEGSEKYTIENPFTGTYPQGWPKAGQTYAKDCSLAFSPNSTFLVAAARSNSKTDKNDVVFWKLGSSQPPHRLKGDELITVAHQKPVVAFRGVNVSEAVIYDLASQQELMVIRAKGKKGIPLKVVSLALSPTADRVVLVVRINDNGTTIQYFEHDIQLWSLTDMTMKSIPFGRGGMDEVNSVAFAADGKTLALAGNCRLGKSGRRVGLVQVWDLETGKVASLMGHRREVHVVAVSPDGTLIASLHDYEENDNSVRVWRRTGGSSGLYSLVDFNDEQTRLNGLSEKHKKLQEQEQQLANAIEEQRNRERLEEAKQAVKSTVFTKRAMEFTASGFRGELKDVTAGTREDFVQAVWILGGGGSHGHRFQKDGYLKVQVVCRQKIDVWTAVFGEPERLPDGYDSFINSKYQRWRYQCVDGPVTLHGNWIDGIHYGDRKAVLYALRVCFY
jgi:WD40 repeat protein